MDVFVSVWAGASALILFAVYLVRSRRVHHAARLRELRWLPLLALSVALGLLPALLLQALSGRPVALPDELSQRPNLAVPRPD